MDNKLYFEDVEQEPILFRNNQDVSFKLLKEYFAGTVKEYMTEINK
jgi:hypothetical protein